jgi:GntR family transcriptional regulator
MRIEPDNPIPIFQQIAEGIRHAVAAGIYRSGDLIPSVRQQAMVLLVNPNTVQRAYEQLEREGLVISRKGVGMVVAEQSRAAAQNGVGQSLRGAFAQTIAAARAAGLSRAAIDRLYRFAFSDVQKGAE